MSFNPKGTFFWLFLGAAAVCATLAYGPHVGMYSFIGLAVGVYILG